MRFVYAIVAFIVAAVMILSGIAQRTVFLGPSALRTDVAVSGDNPYLVIDGSVLTSHEGQQSLSVTGADEPFLAYGRTADVMAWLGEAGAQYDRVTLTADPNSDTPIQTTSATAENIDGLEPDPEANPDPRGSDLWLSESSDELSVLATMSVPDTMSVLIAADGVEPAPSEVKLSWPLDNSTPWAGPLIVGGLLALLAGVVLYILAFVHHKKSRGPRRRGNPEIAQPTRRRLGTGRRSMVAVAGLGLTTAVVLTGCSPAYWPELNTTPTPSGTAEALEDALEDSAPPALTGPQLERIVVKVSDVATQADAELDRDLIATRFDGVALESRLASYTILKEQDERDVAEDDRVGVPDAIPASPVKLTLPQAVVGWPRTVFTVVNAGEDATVAPTALVLTQNSPRSNYTVRRVVKLEPDATIPELAPATLGASLVPPDSSFLTIAPNAMAGAYADLIEKGDESEWAQYFPEDPDSLRDNIKNNFDQAKESLGETGNLESSVSAGEGEPVAFATLNSGALVSVDITETQTATPTEEGVTLSTKGRIRLLSGVEETTTGVETTYGDQLLFYVPPAGSDEKIQLLGFNQGILSSKEIE
ncbi:MAG: hypothetical protein ACTJHU_06625 [Mycetocola sp.]